MIKPGILFNPFCHLALANANSLGKLADVWKLQEVIGVTV